MCACVCVLTSHLMAAAPQENFWQPYIPYNLVHMLTYNNTNSLPIAEPESHWGKETWLPTCEALSITPSPDCESWRERRMEDKSEL